MATIKLLKTKTKQKLVDYTATFDLGGWGGVGEGAVSEGGL